VWITPPARFPLFSPKVSEHFDALLISTYIHWGCAV